MLWLVDWPSPISPHMHSDGLVNLLFSYQTGRGLKTNWQQPATWLYVSGYSGHNNQLVTNNLDCHSRLLFQSGLPTSKHFEPPNWLWEHPYIDKPMFILLSPLSQVHMQLLGLGSKLYLSNMQRMLDNRSSKRKALLAGWQQLHQLNKNLYTLFSRITARLFRIKRKWLFKILLTGSRAL